MSRRIDIDGYTVSVFLPVLPHVPASRAEDAARRIQFFLRQYMASHYDRHMADVDMRQEANSVCEHCGARWTEESATYNGGCCDKDEEARP